MNTKLKFRYSTKWKNWTSNRRINSFIQLFLMQNNEIHQTNVCSLRSKVIWSSVHMWMACGLGKMSLIGTHTDEAFILITSTAMTGDILPWMMHFKIKCISFPGVFSICLTLKPHRFLLAYFVEIFACTKNIFILFRLSSRSVDLRREFITIYCEQWKGLKSHLWAKLFPRCGKKWTRKMFVAVVVL